MKNELSMITILFLVMISSVAAQSIDTTMTIDFQVTTTSPGGNFSPKNIGAIWVEDASGSFVKTLKLWADRRKQYLYTWNSRSGGNTVDGITGATYSSHGTRTASWDFTNTSGDTVLAGMYTLRLEMTDQHAQGPVYSFTFPYRGVTETITPPEQSRFHNMQLTYDLNIIVGIKGVWPEQPMEHALLQNYPNPFNPATLINYMLQEPAELQLAIYNLRGESVKFLVSGFQPAGIHQVWWDGRDENGISASAGVYLCRLEAGDISQTIKMVNLK